MEMWKQEMIVAFDLGAETFSEIPVLDFYTTIPSALLECIKRTLCVMSRVRDGDDCEVWVMDDYGMDESFVKRHAFSQFDLAQV
uniref:F-box associated domain-containing protein n=1 Tax=Lactuca sativa TaxID=4236 RepID=A0A9R1W9Q3_LACSA|nr:hypothetical protein LSAT_V11C200055360 [Lactuca sativa]